VLSPTFEKAFGFRPSSCPRSKISCTFSRTTSGITITLLINTPFNRLGVAVTPGDAVTGGVGEGVSVGIGVGVSVGKEDEPAESGVNTNSPGSGKGVTLGNGKGDGAAGSTVMVGDNVTTAVPTPPPTSIPSPNVPPSPLPLHPTTNPNNTPPTNKRARHFT
jgi:hypothetical protein